MKQLNIQDAGFIYQETDCTPMHISGLGIYDYASTSRQRATLQIIEYLEQRIHIAPILKKKLRHVPGGWDRPFWVDDEEFSLARHVHHLGLPALGNREQLNQLVSQIISEPLDMSRPLWEVYFIENLNNVEGVGKNSFAILTKIHHSCIDGASSANIICAMHDLEPDAKPMARPANDESSAKLPGRYEVLARAYANNVVNSIEQSIAVCKRLPSLTKTATQLYRGERDSGAKLRVPNTRFNKTPGRERIFASGSFKIDDIKAVRRAAPGVTFNDVMVAVVSGGLRKYLQHHDELPAQSLGAMLPQNVRDEAAATESHGNMVSGLFTTIHTDIEDPLERLLAIHNSTTRAKQFAREEDLASIFPSLMGGFLYPRTGKAFARVNQRYRLMERIGPVVLNTVITNVPGPTFPLYHDGAKMVSYAGVPPLTDGVGLSHAIYSYCDQVTLAVVSCRDMMEDADFYLHCCAEAFAELQLKTVGEQDVQPEAASA
jgi:WS/DGAT/MGAT family acyltransferase